MLFAPQYARCSQEPLFHASITSLGRLAGSVDYAGQLYELALELERTQQSAQAKRDEIEARLDGAFAAASGDIFRTLAEAKSYAFEKAALSEADSRRFGDQLKPYLAAKEIYLQNLRLELFEEALQNTRKYVVVSDPNDTEIFIVDLKEQLTPSLYDVTGLEAPKQ